MESLMKSLFLVAVFSYNLVSGDVIDSTCSRTPRVQNGTSGIITSPKHPNNYDDNLVCYWLIRTPEYTMVEISFYSNFRIESTSRGGCFDSISIQTGKAFGAEYCGSTAPTKRYYSGYYVGIQFVSNGAKSYRGFKLYWRLLKVDSSCSKTPIIQNDTSGIITSANYPGYYFNNLNCSWLIIAPENMMVEISFDSHFSIESTVRGNCSDALTIKSETGSNRYCGVAAPRKRVHAGNVTIQFTSGKYRNKAGFKLFWQFVQIKDSYTNSVWPAVGIGLLLATGVTISTILVLRRRRNLRNRKSGNNKTTDPGDFIYLQPTPVGGDDRIYTTQGTVYEDIEDGEVYDNVNIVDVVNVADIRNVTEDDYIVADVRKPPEDEYVFADAKNPPEDTYIISNPPEVTYAVADARNPPEDEYVFADARNPPEDEYVFAGVKNPPEDEYVFADARNPPEDEYVFADARNAPEDEYVFAGVKNPSEDEYIFADVRNLPEDDYIVAGSDVLAHQITMSRI
ncbi:uncharacterized protein LOC141909528 isoform X2 [Tubulanus polymorphus]|uniref:uncharacterized protein LOC141909528 isoform X2 n=1 Tax=Tubulanus polymorphus TaxID=672921 RepID=UPI003DA1CB8E